MTPKQDDDIRLVYIGSIHRAIYYAAGHLPEPGAKASQILAVHAPEDIEGFTLPPDCHIAIELHKTADRGVHPTLDNAAVVFEAVLARRRKPPKVSA
jgi:hypothetical protein